MTPKASGYIDAVLNRGSLKRMDNTKSYGVSSCSGTIPDHTLPSFWANGARVMVGLDGLKLTAEDRAILARCKRYADVIGPCPCGSPAAPSRAWENQETRCDLCGGPACNAKIEICCDCLDESLC